MEELKKTEDLLTEEELDQVAGGSFSKSVWATRVACFSRVTCSCGYTAGPNKPSTLKLLMTGSVDCPRCGTPMTLTVKGQVITGDPYKQQKYISGLIRNS